MPRNICQITENNCSSKHTIPEPQYVTDSSTNPLFYYFKITPFSIAISKTSSLHDTNRLPWRKGLIVNLFKKGDREDPGNYRGITFLSVVGKLVCTVLKNRLVHCYDKEGALHEGYIGWL